MLFFFSFSFLHGYFYEGDGVDDAVAVADQNSLIIFKMMAMLVICRMVERTLDEDVGWANKKLDGALEWIEAQIQEKEL